MGIELIYLHKIIPWSDQVVGQSVESKNVEISNVHQADAVHQSPCQDAACPLQ